MADEIAARNWAANLRALAATQPRLVAAVQSVGAPVAWIYGRDGSLSAHVAGGQWLGGCSLPLAAARTMLKKLDVTGVTACFLSPQHAQQLTAALEKLVPEQAVIAVVPEIASLRIMLGCEDF